MRDVLVRVLTNIAVVEIVSPTQTSALLRIKLFAFFSCPTRSLHYCLQPDLNHSDDHRRLPSPSSRHHRLRCQRHDRYLRCPMDMTLMSVAGDFVEIRCHDDEGSAVAAVVVAGDDYVVVAVGVGNTSDSSREPFDVSTDFHTTTL